MKLKHLFATLSLAVVAGSGIAAGFSTGNSNVQKAEAANQTIYFNFSEFGPTYGDNNEYDTKFFVWACNSNNSVADAWFEATSVSGYAHKVYSISCDESYMKFVAVRGSQSATPAWPNASTEVWNQTCDITRSSTSTKYFWVWSEGDGQFGNKYTPKDIVNTSFDFKNGASYSMTYDFLEFQYSIQSHSITADQQFVVTQGGNTYGYDELEDGCKSMFVEKADNYIGVKNDSLYAVYLKENGKLWAQIDSFEEASQWAEKFVKGVGCTAPYNAKPANWDTFASSFNSLTNGGKDVLIGATPSNAESASYISKAAFIHDLCVSKYDGCSVFMKRDGGGSRAVMPNGIQTFDVTSNSTIYVIIASTLTIASITAFFFFKKKKEN